MKKTETGKQIMKDSCWENHVCDAAEAPNNDSDLGLCCQTLCAVATNTSFLLECTMKDSYWENHVHDSLGPPHPTPHPPLNKFLFSSNVEQ